jgi:hypothetical protein
MRKPRGQFTIRSVMIVVAAVAVLLALWPVWLVLLLVLIVVGGPLAGVIFVLVRVPWREVPWRSVIVNIMTAFFILSGGWLWVWAAAWSVRQRAGTGALAAPSRAGDDAFWALTVPMTATGLCLAAHVSRTVFIGVSRRRSELTLILVGYGWAMAHAWVFLYALLKIQTFP